MTAEVVARASAPGKLFLTGEWAVLRGAPALVAAVDRRATVEARLRDGAGALVVHSLAEDRCTRLGPEATLAGDAAAVAAVLHVVRPQGEVEGAVTVDSRTFLDGDRKLGLGRSSATLAATAAAVLACAGQEDPDAVLATALQANQVLQGGLGSGADVVASVRGGLVEVRRWGEQLSVTARQLPAGLAVLAAWTGESAPTGPLLRRFADGMARPTQEAADAIRELEMAAEDAATAVARGDAVALLRAADRCGGQIEKLGAALDLPLVTPALARLVQAARRPGVAAKPSGAGAGDCAIALVADADTAGAVRAAWRACGLPPLEVAIDSRGVTLG
ncbi:MAG: hypothetical protein U0807_06805 [Candidatus Binatia bacterium]